MNQQLYTLNNNKEWVTPLTVYHESNWDNLRIMFTGIEFLVQCYTHQRVVYTLEPKFWKSTYTDINMLLIGLSIR